jgi:serine/threonine protein kinase
VLRSLREDSWLKEKVADFGFSRLGILDGSHISTIPQGTPGYLDPEYHQNFHLSDKSDVYNFGVVLVESITTMKLVDFLVIKKKLILLLLPCQRLEATALMKLLIQVHKQPLIWGLVQRVVEVAFRCLSFDKDARPTMIEVAEELLLR